jgi:hypothetical protein
MTSQPAQDYSSPERPIRRDVGPPAPGQAYFGYPQPSRAQFPVPQQVASGFGRESDWPTQPTPAVPVPILSHRAPTPPAQMEPPIWPIPRSRPTADQRPYRAHRTRTRSGIWFHLIGYSLTLAFGIEIGIALIRLR